MKWTTNLAPKPTVVLTLSQIRVERGRIEVLVDVKGARETWMAVGANETLTITPEYVS